LARWSKSCAGQVAADADQDHFASSRTSPLLDPGCAL
jgi:hypothetical protein